MIDDDGENGEGEASILMGMGGEMGMGMGDKGGEWSGDMDGLDEEDADAGPGFVIKEVVIQPAPPPEPPKAPPSPVPEAVPLSSQEMFGGTGGDPEAPPEGKVTMVEAHTQTVMSAAPHEEYSFVVSKSKGGGGKGRKGGGIDSSLMPVESALNLIPLILQALVDAWLPRTEKYNARSSTTKRGKKGKKGKKAVAGAGEQSLNVPVCPAEVAVGANLRVIAVRRILTFNSKYVGIPSSPSSPFLRALLRVPSLSPLSPPSPPSPHHHHQPHCPCLRHCPSLSSSARHVGEAVRDAVARSQAFEGAFSDRSGTLQCWYTSGEWVLTGAWPMGGRWVGVAVHIPLD